jgi:signal transduction histidine kinase
MVASLESYIMRDVNKMTTFAIILVVLSIAAAAVLMIVLFRVEAERNRSNTESKYKSSFLANMSHELRTPLNVVIGLTDLIMEDAGMSAHVRDNLIKISNAGSTLLNIVNDILDFSKIESGKLSLSPVEYYTASL